MKNLQIVGGEVTMHPDVADLLTHALNIGLRVEVFSNLLPGLRPLCGDLVGNVEPRPDHPGGASLVVGGGPLDR